MSGNTQPLLSLDDSTLSVPPGFLPLFLRFFWDWDCIGQNELPCCGLATQ